MLARLLEQGGLSTILVTMMPSWAEQHGVPRALAVGFPFAHPLGLPKDAPFQLKVMRQALGVLTSATVPNTIVDSDIPWPGDEAHWRRYWQPTAASPLIGKYMEEIRGMRPPRPPTA